MNKEQRFVEDVGIFFEQRGVPRMAGRVLGWLLICDPPHQSVDELAEALLASKGSISTTTRLLIRLGMVVRTSLPGQRKDYFVIRSDCWDWAMREALAKVSEFRALAEEGLVLQMQRANVGVRCDTDVFIDVPDQEAVAALMEKAAASRASLGSLTRRAFAELAKLSESFNFNVTTDFGQIEQVIQDQINLNRAKTRVAADLSGEGIEDIKKEEAMEQVLAEQALREFEVDMGLVTPETAEIDEAPKELGRAKAKETEG